MEDEKSKEENVMAVRLDWAIQLKMAAEYALELFRTLGWKSRFTQNAFTGVHQIAENRPK